MKSVVAGQTVDRKETRVLVAFLLSAHCGIQPPKAKSMKKEGLTGTVLNCATELKQQSRSHHHNYGCFFMPGETNKKIDEVERENS